jgi:hypothetical protein
MAVLEKCFILISLHDIHVQNGVKTLSLPWQNSHYLASSGAIKMEYVWKMIRENVGIKPLEKL